MDKKQMKVFGIAGLAICAVCVFVSIERDNTNADNVRAMNASPLGGMLGGAHHQQTRRIAEQGIG